MVETVGETENKILIPGEEFHVLGDAVMLRLSSAFDGTRIVEAGTSLVLTEEMVSLAGEDKRGPWTALIADPVGQVGRWGRVKFGVGPATGNHWRHGSPRWEAERRSALEVVWGIADASTRAKALAEVQARFAYGQGQEAFDDE